jgi:hypothetical protein
MKKLFPLLAFLLMIGTVSIRNQAYAPTDADTMSDAIRYNTRPPMMHEEALGLSCYEPGQPRMVAQNLLEMDGAEVINGAVVRTRTQMYICAEPTPFASRWER